MRRGGWVVIAIAIGVASTSRSQERDGRFLYDAYCSACHGAAARGDGRDADLFSPPPANLRAGVLARHDDAELVERIRHGRPLPLGRDPERLEARAGDTDALVAHLRRLSRVDWGRAERGQEIYVERCEICHGPFGHPPNVLPRGVTKPPRDLSDPTYQRDTSNATLMDHVRHGHHRMPAIHGFDVAENRDALLAFVRLLSPGYERYSRLCAGCHGENGRGPEAGSAPPRRPTVVFDEAYFAKTDPEVLRRSIWHMLADASPQMPHMSRALPASDVRAILAFLRTLPAE
jgi:mono/diheme cytochrome c family protein